MADYGNTTGVMAFTRHLLDGAVAFNSTTRPSLTELGTFLTRASNVMNVALAGVGFTTPVSNTTAKSAIDDWVIQRAAEYTELTQRGVGFSDGEGSRVAAFRNLSGAANKFVSDNALGFKRLSVPVSHKTSEGLAFTGETVQADRADRTDTGIVQPVILRKLFDNPGIEEDE
jgi:hypothetical protein